MTTVGFLFEMSVLECQKSGNIWLESFEFSKFLRIYRKQWGLARKGFLLDFQGIVSKPDIWKFHRLWGLLDQTWKFHWISSGRSTKADAKPAPYLIRAVPVEFYTSRIGIFPLIDVLSISWLNLTVPNEFSLHFHLIENSKFLSQNEIFIKTIGFIDSHMITITESYFLTKITLQIFKFCQSLKVPSTVMRHSLHIMN